MPYLAKWLSVGVLVALGSWMASDIRASRYRVYVGTYTGGASQGIYVSELDTATGQMSTAELAAESQDPSFLAIHPNRKFIYAANETSNYQGQKTGYLSAYAIDPESGTLKLLNEIASGGVAPCHLVVDSTGRSLLTANYGGGNVSVSSIRDDGSLGRQTSLVQHEGSSIDFRRQSEPHAHSINLDAENRFAFAADLGLDKVVVYRFDPLAQKLISLGDSHDLRVTPGAGPRHFSFHPSGDFAYVINELDSTINVMSYDADAGRLKTIQTVATLPDDFDGVSHTAEVVVHPGGRFVYGSNRGHDSIAVFAVDTETGKLHHVDTEKTGGETPRNFAVDPSGNFLLAENQGSDTIVLFKIDQETGGLTPTGQKLDVPTPVCVRFLKLGD